jgi:hypothetical protein
VRERARERERKRKRNREREKEREKEKEREIGGRLYHAAARALTATAEPAIKEVFGGEILQ